MNMPLRTPLVTSWPVTEEGRPATLVAALARNAAETGGPPRFASATAGCGRSETGLRRSPR